VSAAGNGAIGATGQVHQAEEFGWRCGAIRIDKSHEVTVATAKRLHDDPALPKLGEFKELDTWIHLDVTADDVRSPVGARVQRH
jgi:hypothetical protein